MYFIALYLQQHLFVFVHYKHGQHCTRLTEMRQRRETLVFRTIQPQKLNKVQKKHIKSLKVARFVQRQLWHWNVCKQIKWHWVYNVKQTKESLKVSK